ncbi:ester cyclase [Paenibacillus algorifonticola]|uniref:ester cyclase n=1 Tax=Paenibacillus algorifonticola TaxID=684063 RepID=UPI003D2DB0C1
MIFFEKVRSGKELDAVYGVMAERVLAHQVQSEKEVTVERSPANYAAHVREMMQIYGEFTLTVEQFLVQDDQVYVRWNKSSNIGFKSIVRAFVFNWSKMLNFKLNVNGSTFSVIMQLIIPIKIARP